MANKPAVQPLLPSSGRDSRSDISPKQKLLTTADIARRLHLCVKTTERKLRAGEFPGAFQLGRMWFMRESDFEAMLETWATSGTAS